MSDNLNIQRRTHLILDHTWNTGTLVNTWERQHDVPGNCNLSQRATFDLLAELIADVKNYEQYVSTYGCELLVKIDGSVVLNGTQGASFPVAAYTVKIANISGDKISLRFQKRDEDDAAIMETVAYREMTYVGENTYGIATWTITDR